MLTDVQVRKLKPKAKPYKAADRDGLYVLIQPTGAKWWRWDYRFAGKRKTLSLGCSTTWSSLPRARNSPNSGSSSRPAWIRLWRART